VARFSSQRHNLGGILTTGALLGALWGLWHDLDPHGAIYDGLMSWLARTSHIYMRPIIPIDLRRNDWVVAYNLLRRCEQAAASVVTDNLVDACSHRRPHPA